MRKLVRLVIRAYRYLVSFFLGNHRCFHPSCSHDALEATDRLGLPPGGGTTLLRLSRCHPWHPGGFDPVPEPRNPRHDG